MAAASGLQPLQRRTQRQLNSPQARPNTPQCVSIHLLRFVVYCFIDAMFRNISY